MERLLPHIEPADCTGCVACIDACTHVSLEMRDGLAVLARPESCQGDQNCADACPTSAIQMAPVPA